MNIARGVAMVMVVLGTATCGDNADEPNASPALSITAAGTTTEPTPIAMTAAPLTTVDVDASDATSASSLPPSGDMNVATTEPGDAPPAAVPFGDPIVVAFDVDDGLPLWTARPSDELRGVTYPIAVDGRVIVQSARCGSNLIAALDAASGEMLWRTDPAVEVPEVNPLAPSVVDNAGVLVTLTG